MAAPLSNDHAVHYEKALPLPGEYTDEVLREWLGYSDEIIAGLRTSAAI